jgi:hypothetical protein
MGMTVLELADKLRSEADAWEFFEGLRWPKGVKCPTCHGMDVYLVKPANGCSCKTVSGSMSQRRTWNCRECRRAGRKPQFSATTGTMMHGTRVALRTWVMVFFEMASSRNGVSACEIERKYNLCPRSAWFLMHRIRESMTDDGLMATMRGTIVADETHIGGSVERMNRKTWKRWQESHGHNPFIKTPQVPVVSLINADTGEVRPRVMPRVNGANLRKVMSEQIDMAGSTLWTDEGQWYVQLGKEFKRHETVSHIDDQYVGANGQTTNKAENFFSQLTRSLDGTFHHVSVEHLPRYLSELITATARGTCPTPTAWPKCSAAPRVGGSPTSGSSRRDIYPRLRMRSVMHVQRWIGAKRATTG